MHLAKSSSNSPDVTPVQEVAGTWQVAFDPKWGGPASVQFDKLVSWTERPEPGIKFYSGTATYSQTFDWDASSQPTNGESRVLLDLGDVRELAEVKLNGQSCGITCERFMPKR